MFIFIIVRQVAAHFCRSRSCCPCLGGRRRSSSRLSYSGSQFRGGTGPCNSASTRPNPNNAASVGVRRQLLQNDPKTTSSTIVGSSSRRRRCPEPLQQVPLEQQFLAADPLQSSSGQKRSETASTIALTPTPTPTPTQQASFSALTTIGQEPDSVFGCDDRTTVATSATCVGDGDDDDDDETAVVIGNRIAATGVEMRSLMKAAAAAECESSSLTTGNNCGNSAV